MKFITVFFTSIILFAFTANAAEKTFTINVKDVNINSLVEQVAAITGENFVVDPQVKGKVTIVSSAPLDKKGVRDLFLSVLRVNGYAAIQNGGVTKIVQQAAIKQGGMEADHENSSSSEEIITSVVPVKNADVNEMVRILKPMVSQFGYLEGSASSNAIIVTDYGDKVKQITKTLQSLDSHENNEMEVVALKQAWVGTLLPLIEKLSPIELGGNDNNRTRLIADERNNSFIIKGQSSDRSKLRSLIEKLDVNSSNSSDIQVIPLHHADAKQVASLLRGLILHEKNSDSSGAAPPIQISALKEVDNLQSPAKNKLSGEASGGDGKIFIQADTALNAIVVRAEPSVMGEIRSVIQQIDIRRAQVLIEAAILEITSDLSNQLSSQFAAGKGALTLNEGGTNFPNQGVSISDLITQLGGSSLTSFAGNGAAAAFGKKDKFSVLIQALSTVKNGNILSTPSIMTLDNEEAKIVVGQNVPFRTGTFSTTNAGVNNPFTTIQREDVGITLKVLPQIHDDNLVRLDIQQDVSSVASALNQAADIVTNKRTIETKVLADNGETIVLGGLMEDLEGQDKSQVPILGDIPILGDLFSSNDKQRSKRNLIIFLRATVIRDKEAMATLTDNRYSGISEAKEYNKTLKPLSVFDNLPERNDDQPQSILPPKHSTPTKDEVTTTPEPTASDVDKDVVPSSPPVTPAFIPHKDEITLAPSSGSEPSPIAVNKDETNPTPSEAPIDDLHKDKGK